MKVSDLSKMKCINFWDEDVQSLMKLVLTHYNMHLLIFRDRSLSKIRSICVHGLEYLQQDELTLDSNNYLMSSWYGPSDFFPGNSLRSG